MPIRGIRGLEITQEWNLTTDVSDNTDEENLALLGRARRIGSVAIRGIRG